MRVLACTMGLVLAGSLAGAAPAGAAKGDVTLVSRQSAADGGAGADGDSGNAAISADGRYVAFRSDADNLSPSDDDAVGNVFVRDTLTNTLTLVSRQSAADGGAGADGDSGVGGISVDGRYVAFSSDADNLSPSDDNSFTNMFLRDLQTNTTTLVSRQSAADGGAGADGVSFAPNGPVAGVSADGRFVSFASDANNLSASDDNTHYNVFVRDLQTNTTILASRQSAADGGAGGNGDSFAGGVTPDGRFVEMKSDADNLSPSDNNAYGNVFVRDLQTNTTILISRQSAADGGAGGNGDAYPGGISPDGRFVAFQANATNLGGPAGSQVYVRDVVAATTTHASRQSTADGGAAADSSAQEASISADGRYVSFSSEANNLSSSDDNSYTNIFVRDLVSGITTLVSRRSTGDGGGPTDDGSYAPRISADGRFVSFYSYANNLSALDDDAGRNVFIADVLGPPPAAPALPPAAPPPGPGVAPDVVAPTLTGLKPVVARVRLAPGAKGASGLRLRLRLSEDARVRMTVSTTVRKGRRKVTVRLGVITVRLKAGTRTVTLPARFGKRRLVPGRYSVRLAATDAAGNTSRAGTITFVVVRGL